MKISDKIEKIGLRIFGGIVVCSGVAFGFASETMEFFRYFVLSGVGYSGLIYWLNSRKKSDERVETLENMLQEADGVIFEQEGVIQNYTSILEDVSVKFPCNCGQNMFDGIFKPEEEIIVDCDYCKSKYAITLKLDKVLISEPIEDLNIDKLIKENTK